MRTSSYSGIGTVVKPCEVRLTDIGSNLDNLGFLMDTNENQEYDFLFDFNNISRISNCSTHKPFMIYFCLYFFSQKPNMLQMHSIGAKIEVSVQTNGLDASQNQ